MEIKANVGLHNKFVIEVRDAETGELKQTATSYNIILDQMYTRLCGGSSYFVNIHFGTGTGTIAASRTSLFTHLGTKAAVDEEQVKSIPNSSWTRKIVINPEEFVDSTFREVGIAFGSTTTNLVTHSLLRDREGTPIGITKTATDVLTIYATVYVTFAEIAGITYLGMPASNTLVNYLIGGSAAPTGSFGLSEIINPHARLGSTSTVTWTSDTGNKQRRTNVQRFSTSTGNGHVKVLDFTNVFALTLPAPGIFSSQPYEAVRVGTGDGSLTQWRLPSCNIRQSTIVVRSNGVISSNYSKAERNNHPVKTANPAVLPTDTGQGVALTSDGLVMAVAHFTSPFVSTYDWTGGVWVRRANPAVLPPSTGRSVALTSDGLVMAVAHFTSPFVTTYDWTGGVWVRRGNPAMLPTGTGWGVALTPNGLVMAVAHDTSPFVTTYDWTGGVWVRRANPAVLPTGSGQGVALTSDGLVMAVAHFTSPFVSTYDWTGGVWVRRANPAVLPPSTGRSVALTSDGLVMALGHDTSPFVSTYDWTGGVWVRRGNPATLPSGIGRGVALTSDGLVMAVAHSTSPFVTTYDWTGGVWVRRGNPAMLPTGTGWGVALTPNGLVMAVAHDTSPFVSTYLHIPTTDIVFNEPPAAGVVVTADYTVDGIHKTDQYVVDTSFAIQFGEIV